MTPQNLLLDSAGDKICRWDGEGVEALQDPRVQWVGAWLWEGRGRFTPSQHFAQEKKAQRSDPERPGRALRGRKWLLGVC